MSNGLTFGFSSKQDGKRFACFRCLWCSDIKENAEIHSSPPHPVADRETGNVIQVPITTK